MKTMATSLTERALFNKEMAMEEVTRGYELTTQLQELLPLLPLDEAQSKLAHGLLGEVFQSLTVALSMLKPATTQHGCIAPMAIESSSICSGDHGRNASLTRVKSKPREDRDQRLQSRKETQITCAPHDDGYRWRKYGQKKIHNHKFQRNYYRCTFSDQNKCLAKKQVQQISDDPPMYKVLYYKQHTCKSFISHPQLIIESLPGEPSLISFESSATNSIKEEQFLCSSLTSAEYKYDGKARSSLEKACSSLSPPISPETMALESMAMAEQFLADLPFSGDMVSQMMTTHEVMATVDQISGTCMSPSSHEWGMYPLWM